jgi:OFA family oxalate/formate antiporter-like MFS transporter
MSFPTSEPQHKRPVLTVVSSFIIMLSLGGIYAWSTLVPELIREYRWTAVQSQLIFGVVIAVFPATMIVAGKLQERLSPRIQAILSAVFFSSGYLLSSFSNGNFYLILSGIGILAGIGTGFGYLTALTVPVKWFPEKKGLITGIVSAGFGLAAVVLTYLIEHALNEGLDVMEIFGRIGLGYGGMILFFSFFLKKPAAATASSLVPARRMLRTSHFSLLVTGIFFGTFAGLLVLGNLNPIGAEQGVEKHTLMIGVSVFAIANFTGRLSWGWISDYVKARTCIPIALLLQALGIFLLGYLPLSGSSYILLSVLIGFGFGSNFVLFAKESASHFGIANLGGIYPYVFLGYALAGILGPLTGGYLYDLTGSFHLATYTASAMSVAGAVLFIITRRNNPTRHS